jgi:hypothetical protein
MFFKDYQCFTCGRRSFVYLLVSIYNSSVRYILWGAYCTYMVGTMHINTLNKLHSTYQLISSQLGVGIYKESSYLGRVWDDVR